MFRLVDPNGKELLKFRPSTIAEPDLEKGIVSSRPGRSGGFWAASIWRYAIEEWSDAETLETIFVRDVPWFPPHPRVAEDVYVSVPPPTTLFHVAEDDVHRLWVYVMLPDPAWRPGIPVDQEHDWQRATFDHLVEVVDVASARLISTGEYEHRLAPICNSSLAYAVVETPLGDLRVRVVEPMIVDSVGRPWNGTVGR